MWDSVPFTKESPFLEPMKKTFFEMAKSGVLKKIWEKYTYSPPNVQCEEKKVSIMLLCKCNCSEIILPFKNPLGFNQLLLPVILLCFGLFLSICIGLIEKAFRW